MLKDQHSEEGWLAIYERSVQPLQQGAVLGIGRPDALHLLGLVLAATTPAHPEADTRPLFKLPQDIEFTGPPDQLQTAVIFGDPTKPGLYVEAVSPSARPQASATLAPG